MLLLDCGEGSGPPDRFGKTKFASTMTPAWPGW